MPTARRPGSLEKDVLDQCRVSKYAPVCRLAFCRNDETLIPQTAETELLPRCLRARRPSNCDPIAERTLAVPCSPRGPCRGRRFGRKIKPKTLPLTGGGWVSGHRMEQRRFFEARSEKSGEWLVLDGKRHPPRVICQCLGWNAPENAALIAAALEAHHLELYSKFRLDGSGRLNEEPVVKPSGEAESARAPKPAARKPRAKHRG